MIQNRERELMELLQDLSEDRVEQLSEEFALIKETKQLYEKRAAMERELLEKFGENKKEFIDYMDVVCNISGQMESFFYRNGILDCLAMVRVSLFK